MRKVRLSLVIGRKNRCNAGKTIGWDSAMNDQDFMEEAFKEALAAGERGECPVGAVLVKDGKIVVRSGNEEIATQDPTAHAEMLCLRRAGKVLGSHILKDCTV